ncbi:hypothetical protein GCM10008019_45390 [Deinococcus soli (ex Cha et al. 2016)]|nr:hypothetical protein GCM10008019_45390 [Deinococcus soli (ex Cha et al. 2016)]
MQTEAVSENEFTVSYGEKTVTFELIYRPAWSRRDFEGVLRQADYAAGTPLVVLPYLDRGKLNALLSAGVSGMDLCGNFALTQHGTWLIYASGAPNRFKIHTPLQNPYQGKSAFVGRALLQQPAYPTVQALQQTIEAQGGTVSLALVSRALNALKADVIVGSTPGTRVLLLQPERLLDHLIAGWKNAQKKPRVLWRGRVAQPLPHILPQLFQNARDAGLSAFVTGLGSASRYADITMENVAYVYAERPELLLKGIPAAPGERFVNLEILELPDPSAAYATILDDEGVRWASALQTYLEMQAGEIRLQESAQPLRQRLLDRMQDLIAHYES